MRRPRLRRRRDELSVVEMQRYNPLRVGVIFLVILMIAVYFGFTKHIPFKHGYRLNAVFATALNIKTKAPVRIAGVDVGKVTGLKREGKTGLVSMEIENRGLPIHSDATLKIRPRIFLEGNWFVELQPGSPSAPTLSSGATIPITQTSNPVQLDQVLDALNTDTRANLQNFLAGYGDALTRKPTAAENAEQDPDVYGLNAAQALNKTYHRSPSALRGSAIVGQATSGSEADDLSQLVASIGKVTRGAERARTGSERTVWQLQHLLPLLREPVHEPRRHGRGAAELAAQHGPRLHGARRGAPLGAHVRAGSDSRRQAAALDDRRDAAVDRPGAGLARAERARGRRQGPASRPRRRSPSCSANSPPSSSRPKRSASA